MSATKIVVRDPHRTAMAPPTSAKLVYPTMFAVTLLRLSRELDAATQRAVDGLRGFGYSWADIAARLGTTRQAAQQRWAMDHRSVSVPIRARLATTPCVTLHNASAEKRDSDTGAEAGDMNLAELIKRTGGGRLQDQLAKEADLSKQMMGDFVRGSAPAKDFTSVRTLRKLAELCRVDIWTVIHAQAETLGIAASRTSATPREAETSFERILPPEAAYLAQDEIDALRLLIVAMAHGRLIATQESADIGTA